MGFIDAGLKNTDLSAGKYTVNDLAAGLEATQKLLTEEKYQDALIPFAVVDAHNLDTGFGTTLRAICRAGMEPAIRERLNLEEYTQYLATLARHHARGFAGMRLAWIFTTLAQKCEGKQALTPVELQDFIARSAQQIRTSLPSAFDTALPALGESAMVMGDYLTSVEILEAAMRTFLAAASLSDQASGEGNWQSSDQAVVLEPSLLAALILSVGCFVGKCTNLGDEKAQAQVSAALEDFDEVLSDLPRLSVPPPVSFRSARQVTTVFDLSGQAGALAQVKRALTGKDPLWAVTQSDLWGWEQSKIVWRSADPFAELAQLRATKDVLLISPPPIRLDNNDEGELLGNSEGAKVIPLFRPRQMKEYRPTVVALSTTPAGTQELLSLGANVWYQPTESENLASILAACRTDELILLTAGKYDEAWLGPYLDQTPPGLQVHLHHYENELELLHFANYACLYQRLPADENPQWEPQLELGKDRYAAVELDTKISNLSDPAWSEIAAAWSQGTAGGASPEMQVRVLVGRTLDSFEFQSLEAGLTRLCGNNIFLQVYVQPEREKIVVQFSW
ncbi:hypothetical protein BK816_05555 [Boudabousia tangfeifanii]|uniref:DhaL domain-containing protein n=1 Tax=Boudabousia tangfeifanii TaxID=1912795 RepID=A0A1D9MKL5_9ACTO|nr:hypothetical protein [Boudabousia tangfeifanii]AOZ72826.1 hypothetical protein BK816_05555 [Boudabousia tangfeifanii]